MAEKWARLHHLPFPKIDRTVYEKEGLKECYVFKDEDNVHAPVILHFVLCNIQFRKFVKPGRTKSWNIFSHVALINWYVSHFFLFFDNVSYRHSSFATR